MRGQRSERQVARGLIAPRAAWHLMGLMRPAPVKTNPGAARHSHKDREPTGLPGGLQCCYFQEAAVVFSGLCSQACLLGLWASGHPLAVPGQFHVSLTPLSGQSLSLGPESGDVRRCLLSGQSAAVLQPVGKQIGPDGRSESEGQRGAGWALLVEDSQARGAAIGCGVWSTRRSERPSVRLGPRRPGAVQVHGSLHGA